jgi:hypothetical protein
MPWVITDLVLAAAGSALLAALGLRVAREVGRLVAELRRALHGIRAAAEDLEQVTAALEARGPRPQP